MKCVGIVIYKKKYIVGKANGLSPGLETDAQLYEDEFKLNGYTVKIIKPWIENDVERRTTITNINACDMILGIEELGSDEIVKYIIDSKVHICVMINPEVLTGQRHQRALMSNIKHISSIIVKTKGQKKLAEEFLKKNGSKAHILVIRHKALPPKQVEKDKNVRKSIVHFAGVSPYKNTYEQVLAGIQLVRKHGYKSLILKLTYYKDNYFLLDAFTIGEIMKLVKNNSDIIELMSLGYISEEDKASIYNRCSLALCASNAEGFGLYIAEAAYYGCQVITTDGIPMNEVLKKQVAYATPSSITNFRYGKYHTIPCDNILAAYSRLPPYDIEEASSNISLHEKAFASDFVKAIKYFNKLL